MVCVHESAASVGLAVLVLVGFVRYSDCQVTAWTSPAAIGAATGNAGITPAVDETSTANAALFTATATGAATSNAYALEQNPGSIATIDPTSGAVTLAGTNILDFEAVTGGELEFVITAQPATANEASGSATFTLTVGDVNDNTPAFGATSFDVSVADSSPSGTSVTTVTATDADGTAANNVIQYAIESGNTNTDFAIHATSGLISVAATNGLSKATTASYALVVTATDSGTTALTGTTTVSVTFSGTKSNMASGIGVMLFCLVITYLQ